MAARTENGAACGQDGVILRRAGHVAAVDQDVIVARCVSAMVICWLAVNGVLKRYWYCDRVGMVPS